MNLDLAVEDLLERLRAGQDLRGGEGDAGRSSTSSGARTSRRCASWRCARWRRASSAPASVGHPGSAEPVRRATSQRVMVCIASHSPRAQALLRRGSRLAGRLNTDWFVRLRRDAGRGARTASTPRRSATCSPTSRRRGSWAPRWCASKAATRWRPSSTSRARTASATSSSGARGAGRGGGSSAGTSCGACSTRRTTSTCTSSALARGRSRAVSLRARLLAAAAPLALALIALGLFTVATVRESRQRRRQTDPRGQLPQRAGGAANERGARAASTAPRCSRPRGSPSRARRSRYAPRDLRARARRRGAQHHRAGRGGRSRAPCARAGRATARRYGDCVARRAQAASEVLLRGARAALPAREGSAREHPAPQPGRDGAQERARAARGGARGRHGRSGGARGARSPASRRRGWLARRTSARSRCSTQAVDAFGQRRPRGARARRAAATRSRSSRRDVQRDGRPHLPSTGRARSASCCRRSRPRRRPSTACPIRCWSSTPAGDVLSANRAAERAASAARERAARSRSTRPTRRSARRSTRRRAHVLGGKGAFAAARLRGGGARAARGRRALFLPRGDAGLRAKAAAVTGATVVLQDVTRLRRFDELRNDLVATVAHEFRTPLTSLRMAIHLCLEEAAGPARPRSRRICSTPRARTASGCRRSSTSCWTSRASRAARIELRAAPIDAAQLVREARASTRSAGRASGRSSLEADRRARGRGCVADPRAPPARLREPRRERDPPPPRRRPSVRIARDRESGRIRFEVTDDRARHRRPSTGGASSRSSSACPARPPGGAGLGLFIAARDRARPRRRDRRRERSPGSGARSGSRCRPRPSGRASRGRSVAALARSFLRLRQRVEASMPRIRAASSRVAARARTRRMCSRSISSSVTSPPSRGPAWRRRAAMRSGSAAGSTRRRARG